MPYERLTSPYTERRQASLQVARNHLILGHPGCRQGMSTSRCAWTQNQQGKTNYCSHLVNTNPKSILPDPVRSERPRLRLEGMTSLHRPARVHQDMVHRSGRRLDQSCRDLCRCCLRDSWRSNRRQSLRLQTSTWRKICHVGQDQPRLGGRSVTTLSHFPERMKKQLRRPRCRRRRQSRRTFLILI